MSPRSRLLNPRGDRLVRDGFRQLLPIDSGIEQHLRGVITDALTHPGSLLRAILGALALINQGYALVWEVIGKLPEAARLDASRLVSSCLGVAGVLNGQSLDLHFDSVPSGGFKGGKDSVSPPYSPEGDSTELSEEDVLKVAEGKTVSLIRLTLLLPAVVAGVDALARDRLERLATVWGLAYQIADDFKDCLMSGEETGKSTSRDQLLGRPNLPGQTGLERALERLDAFLAEGREIVGAFGAESWPQLSVLQEILEDERRKVVDHLPAELRQPVSRRPASRQTVSHRTDVLSFADRQLARWAGREKTLIVTVPAPRVAPEALLAVRGRAPGFLWAPGGERGAAWAGLGAAHRIELDGEDRFRQLRRQADQMWRRLVTASYGGSRMPAARLYGGLAFDVGAAAEELWRDFGDGAFTLPRFLYSRDGERAWLSLAVRGEEIADAVERDAGLAELEEVLAALAAYRDSVPSGGFKGGNDSVPSGGFKGGNDSVPSGGFKGGE